MSRDHHILEYSVCGSTVELVLEAATLLEPLRVLFAPYETDSRRGAPHGTPAVTVSGVDSGYLVRPAQGVVRTCGTLTEVLSVCEFALTQAFMEACDRMVPVHAGGAVVRGRAVLALGRAGAGKSSLAVSWHLAGHAALGDDVVMVDGDGSVHPFKRLYEVRASVLEELGVKVTGTPLWEPGSSEAWYDPGVGAGWGDPAPLGVVAVVRHDSKASLEISELSPLEALNALVHSQMTSVWDRAANVDALARAAEQATALDIVFGSAAEAAEAIAGHVA